jgi:hypothetical protein
LVTYRNSNEEVPVTEYNLQSYVPVPVDGEKAVTEFTDDTRGVKGTVQWNPAGPAASMLNRAATVERSDWSFVDGEEYTANIIMEALPGWYFTENDFIYPEGLVQTQPASSRDPKKRDLSPVGFNITVINIFPPPGDDPGSGGGGGGGDDDPNTPPGGGTNPDPNNPASYVIALDNYIPAPSVGETPTSGGKIDQYYLNVAVAWWPNDAVFADKAYTANVTLTADPHYTLGRVTGFTYKGTSLPFIFENNGAGAQLVINFPKPGIGGGSSSSKKVGFTGITPPEKDANIDFSFHSDPGLRYEGNTVSWSYGYAVADLNKNNYKTEIENTSETGTGWLSASSPAEFIGGKVYRARVNLTTPDAGWFNEVKEFTSTDKNVWGISFTTSDGGNKAEVIIDFKQLPISTVVKPGGETPPSE